MPKVDYADDYELQARKEFLEQASSAYTCYSARGELTICDAGCGCCSTSYHTAHVPTAVAGLRALAQSHRDDAEFFEAMATRIETEDKIGEAKSEG